MRLWTIKLKQRDIDIMNTQETALLTMQEQHKRLGHIGYTCIKAMESSRRPLATGFGKTREQEYGEEDCRDCEVCKTTKSHVTPNRGEVSRNDEKSRPGKVLHMDTLE